MLARAGQPRETQNGRRTTRRATQASATSPAMPRRRRRRCLVLRFTPQPPPISEDRAADEDFDNDALRGVRRQLQNVDMVRVQDAGLRGADDPTVLDWAARESRPAKAPDPTAPTTPPAPH